MPRVLQQSTLSDGDGDHGRLRQTACSAATAPAQLQAASRSAPSRCADPGGRRCVVGSKRTPLAKWRPTYGEANAAVAPRSWRGRGHFCRGAGHPGTCRADWVGGHWFVARRISRAKRARSQPKCPPTADVPSVHLICLRPSQCPRNGILGRRAAFCAPKRPQITRCERRFPRYASHHAAPLAAPRCGSNQLPRQ